VQVRVESKFQYIMNTLVSSIKAVRFSLHARSVLARMGCFISLVYRRALAVVAVSIRVNTLRSWLFNPLSPWGRNRQRLSAYYSYMEPHTHSL
jgi:hypothetical protein